MSNPNASLEDSAARIKKVADGLQDWWQGDEEHTTNNGQVDLPSPANLAKQVADISGTVADARDETLDAKTVAIEKAAEADNSALLAAAQALIAALAAANTLINTPNRGVTARAINTAALPAFTVSGDGLTITGNVNGAIPSASTDNVALGANDLFWHWDHTGAGGTNAGYGLLRLVTVGDGSTPFSATRPTACNTAQKVGFACAPVGTEGTKYGVAGGAVFRVTNDPAQVTLGATAIQVGATGGSGLNQFTNALKSSFETRKIVAGGRLPAFLFQNGKMAAWFLNGDFGVRGFDPATQSLIQAFLGAAGLTLSKTAKGAPPFMVADPVSGRIHAIVRRNNKASWYGHHKGEIEATRHIGNSQIRSDTRALYYILNLLASILATGTGVARLAGVGDSWLERRMILQFLAGILYPRYGRAADGWVSLNATGTDNTEGTLRALNDIVLTTTGLTKRDISEIALGAGRWAHDGMGFDVTGAFTANLTGGRCGSFWFPYVDTQISFNWSVPGGPSGSVVGGNTGAMSALEITGLDPSVPHSLVIDGSANTHTGTLFGIYLNSLLGTVPMVGIELSKCANGGSTAPQMASVQADEAAIYILNKIRPDHIFSLFGTNDARTNVSPAAYKAGEATILSAFRAPNPKASAQLIAPPPNGRPGLWQMFEYRDQLLDLAFEQGCATLNLPASWGDFATMDAIGAWTDDDLHPTFGSGRWIAADMANPLMLN